MSAWPRHSFGMSFPRKRESMHEWELDPRLRGDDAGGAFLLRLVLLMLLSFSLPTLSMAELPAARQAELRHLLKQDCGSCHGMTLKGGLGPSLLPSALEGKPDALLVNTVLYGREGTAMPPWEPMLTEEEVVWLVERLREGDLDE